MEATVSIDALMTTFAGRPVRRLDPRALPDEPAGSAWRLAAPSPLDDDFDGEVDLGDNAAETLLAPLESWPGAAQLEALVIGCWDHPEELCDSPSAAVAARLAALAPRLPALEALFLGDIPHPLNELFWIQQSDLSGLLHSLPNLRSFGARGGEGLGFSDLRHDGLEVLELQTGDLSARCIHDITRAHLPRLRRLDLWLGARCYGFDATVDDLAPLFSGKLLPQLTHLGLMNADIADAIAEALASAPVVERLEVLDLSLGDLTDAGLGALLKNPALKRLKCLDLRQSLLTPASILRLSEVLPSVVRLTHPQRICTPPGGRYHAPATSDQPLEP